MALPTSTPPFRPAPPPQTKTASPPQPLTLPPLTHATLSPNTYLSSHLLSSPPTRPSHRSPSTPRAPLIHTSCLTHTNGSAVVRTGDTAVVCGVRGEILRAEDIPNYEHNSDKEEEEEEGLVEKLGLVVPNVELATGCTRTHIPTGPPSPEAQELTRRLERVLAGVVGSKGMGIYERDSDSSTSPSQPQTASTPKPQPKAFWTLYVDVVVISLDGPAFDAVLGSVVAALKDTVLPRAWWDGEVGGVVCDERAEEGGRVVMGRWPVGCSFGVFVGEDGGEGEGGEGWEGWDKEENKTWVLADVDGFEEGLCREVVTVVVDGVDEEGKVQVARVEKSGGGFVGAKEMRRLVEVAGRRWREWMGVMGT